MCKTKLQHQLDRIEHKLDRILEQVGLLLNLNRREKMTLDDLKAQVQKNADVEASAVVLIQGIAAQLAAAGGNPAQIQALADQLKTSADALSAAIVANTPAAPGP